MFVIPSICGLSNAGVRRLLHLKILPCYSLYLGECGLFFFFDSLSTFFVLIEFHCTFFHHKYGINILCLSALYISPQGVVDGL